MNNSVLIICTSLNMGGSEKQAVWLANKLIEENKKVYFVSLKDAGILSTELSPKISVNNLLCSKLDIKIIGKYFVV